MGKGDNRRPTSISKEEYDANFEAAFGKKKLRVWEDAPRLDDGDRPDSGQAPEMPESSGGPLHPETPDPLEEKKCPRCGSENTYVSNNPDGEDFPFFEILTRCEDCGGEF